VPVGLDVRESDRIIAGVKGAPVSLWFDVPDGAAFTCGASGSDYYRFKAALVNPSGEIVASKDVVSGGFWTDVPGGASGGRALPAGGTRSCASVSAAATGGTPVVPVSASAAGGTRSCASAAPVSAKRSSESNRLGGSLFFFFLLISLKISVSVYYTKTP